MTEKTTSIEYARPFLRFAVVKQGRIIARTEKRGDAASIANKTGMARVVDMEESDTESQ